MDDDDQGTPMTQETTIWSTDHLGSIWNYEDKRIGFGLTGYPAKVGLSPPKCWGFTYGIYAVGTWFCLTIDFGQ